MVSLKTEYLGIELKNPLIVASSGLTGHFSNLKKAEDAGAGGVVLKSLFEEQILAEAKKIQDISGWVDHTEALDYINNMVRESTLENYITMIEKSSKELSIPIIGSINCLNDGDWVEYGKKIEKAGAKALELNLYIIPKLTDTPEDIENRYINIYKKVSSELSIPVSIKIGSNFTSLYHIIKRFTFNKVPAVTLFNRFYNPDIDLNTMRPTYSSPLSEEHEYTTALRWISLLYSKFNIQFSATTGIHSGETAIKMVLAGASTVQLASAIYKSSFNKIDTILSKFESWMEQKGYSNISQFRGALSEADMLDYGFERFQYIRALNETASKLNKKDY